MPRAFTEAEQARIREGLLAAGRERFLAEGLEGTSLTALCKAVDIGKGTFYQFFPSKEALFFAIHEAEESEHRAELMGALARMAGRPPLEVVERYFVLQWEMLDQRPFLQILTRPGTVEALQRRVPVAQIERHRAGDRAFMEGVGAMWLAQGVLPPGTAPRQVYLLSAALFAFSRSRGMLGEDYAEAGRAMTRAFARLLTSPPPA